MTPGSAVLTHQVWNKSLGSDGKLFNQSVKTVKLLGNDGKLEWKQEADSLAIICPWEMPFST
jgi:alpha-L-fucosidase